MSVSAKPPFHKKIHSPLPMKAPPGAWSNPISGTEKPPNMRPYPTR